MSFRDNLRSDLNLGIFSFVSIDGDRGDYLRAVRKVAEDGEICGMFFVSRLDFEFSNFTLNVLTRIMWEIAVENGAQPDEYIKLQEAAAGCKSAEAFIKAAKRTLPSLNQLSKGKNWGERLMAFAWDNPENIKMTRSIVEAVNFAIRSVNIDYHLSRTRYRVDPQTGRPIDRKS